MGELDLTERDSAFNAKVALSFWRTFRKEIDLFTNLNKS